MRNDRALRLRLAVEAARIFTDEGLRDYRLVKRKAAQRLGVRDERSLPSNAEIDEAVREHQRLFQRSSQPQALRQRREAALQAMSFLRQFQPKLVGAVLDGSADQHSAVCLHLHEDSPEAVLLFLAEQGIPIEESTRHLRLDDRRSGDYPVFKFAAGDVDMDLTVLPSGLLRQAPLGPFDDRPLRRASYAQLKSLLAEAA